MGEQDIDYQPQTSIMAQALANFLVEIPDTLKSIPKIMLVDPSEPEASWDIWELHTDVAASKEGSKAGQILKNPSSDEITYFLWFNF